MRKRKHFVFIVVLLGLLLMAAVSGCTVHFKSSDTEFDAHVNADYTFERLAFSHGEPAN